MTKQPEALRIAEVLAVSPQYTGIAVWQAIKELRRQHEAIKQLREALTDLSWYADQLEQIVYPIDEQDIDHEIQAKAEQALKDTEEL